MLKKIGGGLGILAFLGLIVAVLQLLQARNSAIDQLSMQATLLAQSGEQLSIAREMETLQSNDNASPSNATAAAKRIEQLEATSAALATAQARVILIVTTPTATIPPKWNEQSNSVPETGVQIIRDLAPGEFLYLTGGSFAVNKIFCGNDAYQICVLVFESTKSQRVVINQLIPKNNYLARTFRYNYEELIQMNEEFYWKWPNCQSSTGCTKATIYYLIDGNLQDESKTLTRP
jgi:hypothetical protein